MGLALVLAVLVALTPCAVQVSRNVIRALGSCVMLAPAAFDREMWSARFPCNRRGSMADDVETSVLKSGMTRPEVTVLLGEPDAPNYPSDHDIAYEMGCWIDCDWLVVGFDDAWHLIDTYQFQD